jgi:spoIIIJ-associated protein
MISKQTLATIEQEAKILFGKLGLQGESQATANEENQTIAISFKTEDPKLFIGERGQTLFEIQHVFKLMMRRKQPDLADYYISLDINDYKKNKEEYLRDLAKTTADEVSLLKKPKELPPMPPAERRVVHETLTERSDVVSESIGEGLDRRIVVKVKE